MKAYLRITKQRCKPLAAEIFQKSPKTMQLSVNNIFSFRFPGEDCDVPARWCAIPPRLSQNHRCKNRSRCGCLTISLARFKESRDGAVAQLVERIVRNDEVRGSIPLGSTILSPAQYRVFCACGRTVLFSAFTTATVPSPGSCLMRAILTGWIFGAETNAWFPDDVDSSHLRYPRSFPDARCYYRLESQI